MASTFRYCYLQLLPISLLEIEFNSGAVWNYHDFPLASWYEFEGAESHGKFFHSFIKNNYRESQVG
ncbi:KTSC domain-containing protein [Salmonella enterica]|uniref:KTSC domain-containing protein n=1 Tax=Salmonella enterica TaxID=28901 RepID=UPI003D3130E0